MDLLSNLFAALTELIDSLSALVTDSPLTYLAIMALSALDVLAPILPAEATITAASVLAGQGKLNVVWIMLAAGIGAFIGDNVAYWIGRVAGRPLVEKVLRGNTEQLDTVQEQFDRRGGTFIIVGRFIPGGRTAVAIGAGVLRFRWSQFLLYDAVAAVIWAFQAAIPGFIGGSLIQDRPWLAMIFGFVLSALLATGIALLQRRRDGPRAAETPVKPAVPSIGGVDASIGGVDASIGGVVEPASTGLEAAIDAVPDVETASRSAGTRSDLATIGWRTRRARRQTAADDGDADPQPGERGGPQQGVVADGEDVSHASADGLAREGAQHSAGQDGGEMPAELAAHEHVDAGMERTGQQ